MNPYEVLGISKKTFSIKVLKAAYRSASAYHHPDNQETGNREKFEEIKLAYDILSDPARRKRYDTTGRVDQGPVTPEAIQVLIRGAVEGMINKEGHYNDPVWANIKNQVLLSIKHSRREIQNNMAATQRKLERVERLLERLKPKTKADPVGDELRVRKALLTEEAHSHQDAMELSHELERIFLTYDYGVGPGPEGQYSPGPTARASGPRRLSAPATSA